MRQPIFVLLVAACLVARVPAVEARQWTSAQGTPLEAELVSVVPHSVVLRNEQDKSFVVPIASLSARDQLYVKSVSGSSTEQASRTWFSRTGTTASAALVEIRFAVILRTADGTQREVTLEQLSEADRTYTMSLIRPDSPRKSQPAAAEDWSLTEQERLALDAPLSGSLLGHPFRMDEAELRGGTLVISGGRASDVRRVDIHLFPSPGEDLAGKRYRMPDARQLRSPVARLVWYEGFAEQSETYLGDYTMLLELGDRYGDRLAGRLLLRLPDPQQSHLTGKFAAKVVAADAPEAP